MRQATVHALLTFVNDTLKYIASSMYVLLVLIFIL